MKIIPRALSAGLALAAVPAQAFVTYQDIVSAATNPDDLSRQALVTIFGDVVTNPLTASSNTIIGNLFMVFNAIIATMGIVWFLFIGIRHAVRTGHQGSVFNNGRDVVGILSVVSGFLMIVPTASGWSLARQVIRIGGGTHNVLIGDESLCRYGSQRQTCTQCSGYDFHGNSGTEGDARASAPGMRKRNCRPDSQYCRWVMASHVACFQPCRACR